MDPQPRVQGFIGTLWQLLLAQWASNIWWLIWDIKHLTCIAQEWMSCTKAPELLRDRSGTEVKIELEKAWLAFASCFASTTLTILGIGQAMIIS